MIFFKSEPLVVKYSVMNVAVWSLSNILPSLSEILFGFDFDQKGMSIIFVLRILWGYFGNQLAFP